MDKAAELAAAVLNWWKEHEYDTTGPWGEWNVYDNEPNMVTLAKRIIPKRQRP